MKRLMPLQTQKRKIVTDSIAVTAAHFLKQFRGLIFLPVIIAAVGLEDYAAFAQILINTNLIAPLCTLALGNGFLRYTSKYDDDAIKNISQEYWTVLAASGFFVVIGAILLYVTGPILDDKILGGAYLPSLRLSPLILVNNVLWLQNSLFLQARKQFKRFSLYDFMFLVLPYVGFVSGVFVNKRLFDGLVVYIVVQSCLSLIILRSITKCLQRTAPSLAIFRKFFLYSWPLMFTSMTSGIIRKIDRYFIGYLMDMAALGLYNIVCSIVGVLEDFVVPFVNYFGAYMPKLWDRGETQKVKDQIKEGLLYYWVCCLGLLVVMTLEMKPFLILILRKRLPHSQHFELFVFVIGVGVICLGISRFLFQMIRYQQKNHYVLAFMSFAALVNIIFNSLWIPKYGLLGAGLATLLSYFSILVLCNLTFSINLDAAYVVKLLKSLGITAPIMLGLQYLKPQNSLQVFAAAGVYLTLYVAFILWTKVITIHEVKRRLF